MGIVEAAMDEARQRNLQVSAVHRRLGALSGVVKDALLFSYEVACQDTPLEGSRLLIEKFLSRCFVRKVKKSACWSRCSRSVVQSAHRRLGKYFRERN